MGIIKCHYKDSYEPSSIMYVIGVLNVAQFFFLNVFCGLKFLDTLGFSFQLQPLKHRWLEDETHFPFLKVGSVGGVTSTILEKETFEDVYFLLKKGGESPGS